MLVQPRPRTARFATAAIVLVALSCIPIVAGRAAAQQRDQTERPPRPEFVKAVVIDPADHFQLQPDAAEFSRSVVDKLAANGVNTVYINAYNVAYGAYYRTDYRHNEMTPYGRQDLLGKFIDAAHGKGIRVFGAVYDHEHAPAWEANPGWRAKTRDGGDYEPTGTAVTHFLSVAHPEARDWWMGFLRDIVKNYPDLDGVELREPVVNWWGDAADYNPAANQLFGKRHPGQPLGGTTWHRHRERMLTDFLKEEISLVQRSGMEAHVTSVASALESGELMSVSRQATETGFDLDGLLSGDVRPDAIKPEIMWQQWAAVYGYDTFTPKWTREAVERFVDDVAQRVPIIVHVEATDFGSHWMSLDEVEQMLLASTPDGVHGVDLYSVELLDQKQAWPIVKSFFASDGEEISSAERSSSLVLYDGARGELARVAGVQLVNLLGHFKGATSRLHPVEDYRSGEVEDFDRVFYLGSKFENAPDAFTRDLVDYDGEIVWAGMNLFQLKEAGREIPIEQPTQDATIASRKVEYRGESMADKGELYPTEALEGARVLARARDGGELVPFAVRAGKLWYFAGSPFDFPESVNARYAVFADVLHDIVGEEHRTEEAPRAFVRIEDVNPMTDPRPLKALADLFHAREMPFLVAFFPFYRDPAAGIDVTLSQKPDLADALRYMQKKGGTVILHGSSHQYEGRSGIDWEFWDPKTAGGVPEDGGEYVREKVESALTEVWRNDIHPMAWETPHYGATALDYSIFGNYFTTFVERRIYGVWELDDYQQAMPYVIEQDVYGARIVPENLGYVREPQDVDRILADARALTTVRDGVAGAFVHPTVAPDTVAKIVDGLQDLGYEGFDLREVPSTVRTATRVETNTASEAELAIAQGRMLEERIISADGEPLESKRMPVDDRRRYASALDEADGRILSIAVDPPELVKRGFEATMKMVREHADRTVVWFGAIGAFLLLMAYAQLKVQGAVEVRRAVPVYLPAPHVRREPIALLPPGPPQPAEAGLGRTLVLASFAAAGAAYGLLDGSGRKPREDRS